MGRDKALKDVRDEETAEIPAHLRDAHYSGAEKLGSGLGYKYPHDFPNSEVEQDYLPYEYRDKKYYIKGDNDK